MAEKRIMAFSNLPSLIVEVLKPIVKRKGYDTIVASDSPVTDADFHIVESSTFIANRNFYDTTSGKYLIYFHNTSNIDIRDSFSCDSSIETLESQIPDPPYKNRRYSAKVELSIREIDVIREIASGKTYKEIADCLNISVNTVLTHRKNIISKLGIKSVAGLSLYAMMNGLLKV